MEATAAALHSLMRLLDLPTARGGKQKYEFLFPEFVSSHLSCSFYSDINITLQEKVSN
jgi:hypothetical protein